MGGPIPGNMTWSLGPGSSSFLSMVESKETRLTSDSGNNDYMDLSTESCRMENSNEVSENLEEVEELCRIEPIQQGC